MPITRQVAPLLAEWAAVPTTPATELSAEKVRATIGPSSTCSARRLDCS
jgi:hypothetical protein